MKEITTICDVVYKEKVIEEGKGEKIQIREKKRIPMYVLNDLKKNKNIIEGSIDDHNYGVKFTEITDIKRAIKNKKSKDELISIKDLELQALDNEVTKYALLYQDARATNRTSKYNKRTM